MWKAISVLFGGIGKFLNWLATQGRVNEVRKTDNAVASGNDATVSDKLRHIRESYERKRDSAS